MCLRLLLTSKGLPFLLTAKEMNGDSASLLMDTFPSWSRPRGIPPPPFTLTSPGNSAQPAIWADGREWFHSAFDPVLPRMSLISQSLPPPQPPQNPIPSMVPPVPHSSAHQITELCYGMENTVKVSSLSQSPDGSLDLSKKHVSLRNLHRDLMEHVSSH